MRARDRKSDMEAVEEESHSKLSMQKRKEEKNACELHLAYKNH